jgi:hypothetical protein
MRATTTTEDPRGARSGASRLRPHRRRSARRPWTVTAASATAAVSAALLAGLAASAPATAAEGDPLPLPVDCPTALPTTDAVDGVTGTGWTVERGTAADPFSARVLGRIADGIAPGVDMIMADLDSPALQRAGGVWAGMSGSPVYTEDGRLIGSVSYGFAASSIAGITPADSLATLFADPDDAAPAPARVRVPGSTARRLARTGEVTAAEAAQGFRPLPLPLSVSGVSGPGAARLAERLSTRTGLRVVTGGSSSASAATAPADAIASGGNAVAAVSHGYVTLAATGTTTYTCAGRAVLFGHPLLDGGVVRMSLHPADAVYVQPDPVWGPFKLANPGGVAGTIDRDRTLGLRAQVGATPSSTTVTTAVTRAETGLPSGGTTEAVERTYTPDAAAFSALYGVDQAMRSSNTTGSFRGTLTITGTRTGGRPFSVTLGNSFVNASTSTQVPLDYQVADWVYGSVLALTEQPFERVSLSRIELAGTASSTCTFWRTPKVQVYRGRGWVTPTSDTVINARVGSRIPWRATAVLSGTPSVTETRSTSYVVPTSAADRDTSVVVGAGEALVTGMPSPEPTSLDGLITKMSTTPRNDEVRVELRRTSDDAVLVYGTMRFSRPVQPFATTYQSSVTR